MSNSVPSPGDAGCEVVELGSRPSTRGALWGDAESGEEPGCGDRIVVHLPIDGGWNHVEGLQVMGGFLPASIEYTGDDLTVGFRIADVREPLRPVWGAMQGQQRVSRADAGATALTRLYDGMYMVMVFGHDSNDVEGSGSREKESIEKCGAND